MWNSIKSIKMSTVFTKVVMVLIIMLAIALPVIRKRTPLTEMFMLNSREIDYVIPVIYICVGIALVALFYLCRLLANIRRDVVFVSSNVRILRVISWCCFLAGAVLIFGAFFSLSFLLMAVMAGFVGLILRVVKNVFEAAVELKTENDYTI